MDFSFSEEQEAVRELADRIFTDLSTQERLREIETGARTATASTGSSGPSWLRPACSGSRCRRTWAGPAWASSRRDWWWRRPGAPPPSCRWSRPWPPPPRPWPASDRTSSGPVAPRRGHRGDGAHHGAGRAGRIDRRPRRRWRSPRRRVGAQRRQVVRALGHGGRRRPGAGPNRPRLRGRLHRAAVRRRSDRGAPDRQHRSPRGGAHLLRGDGGRRTRCSDRSAEGPADHRVAGATQHHGPGPRSRPVRPRPRSPWWRSTRRPASSSASRSPRSRRWASGRPTPTSTPRPSG